MLMFAGYPSSLTDTTRKGIGHDQTSLDRKCTGACHGNDFRTGPGSALDRHPRRAQGDVGRANPHRAGCLLSPLPGLPRPRLSPPLPLGPPLPLTSSPGRALPGLVRASQHDDDDFGGSQSRQALMATVTALVLWPSHGGMIAPNPPAGPPAAITNRCSGVSSAA